MTPVSNQTELLNAVASKETHIQAVSDFTVSKQITVRCSLTLTGCSDECPVSLYKDASFPSAMFHVSEGGSLTLQNIVLDGQKELHSGRDPMNRSLILISGGTLILKHGTVLRNNHSYTEGGGVLFFRHRFPSKQFPDDRRFADFGLLLQTLRRSCYGRCQTSR